MSDTTRSRVASILILSLLNGSACLAAESAITEGEGLVLFNQGTARWFGYDGRVDKEAACDLFEKSAELGYPDAQFNLGNCYRTGVGREKNIYRAIVWYEKAARNEVSEAKSALGSLLVLDSDDAMQTKKGVELLREAHAEGVITATFVLGIAHAKGTGVPPDQARAVELLWEAAAQGHALAQALLSYMYANGLYGAEPNSELSEMWRKAVELNMRVDREPGERYEAALDYLRERRFIEE